MNIDTKKMTIGEAQALMEKGDLTSVTLTEACLSVIGDKDTEIHAFLEVFGDVLDQARAADERRAQGERGPLLGVPMSTKDNIMIKGRIASAGSRILEGYVATYDATVIERLRSAGAVFMGRANMDEFAMGSSTENSAYGPTRNPHDLSRVPGGTSGGPAASVASGMVLGALGTDTAGSVRQPAGFCGVVGMCPTYGGVSRFGTMSMASSFDQISPIAKTVEDMMLIHEVITGEDSLEATCMPSNLRTKPPLPKRIGVPRSFLGDGIAPDVYSNFNNTLVELGKTYEIVDVALPSLENALAAYYILMPAEVSSNMARYDGMRYGLSVESRILDNLYQKTRAAGFGREVRRRILLGTYVLSAGYYDAYYEKANRVRDKVRADFAEAFLNVDAIAMPTSPTTAFPIGEKADDPVTMYLADIFTVPSVMADLPAIAVPSGVSSDSLPYSIQFIGPRWSEYGITEIARAVEKISPR